MTPDTYAFTGDATTGFGLFGIIGTLVILITIFRSFSKSPLNK
jgi:hypothetical protein